MDFLGNSQTFLGTLATLAILCVLFSESNFIHEILKDIKEGFKNEIKSMRVNTNFENIIESNEYKLLSLFVKGMQGNSLFLRFKGIKLLSEITLAKQSIQLKYAPSEDEGQNVMGQIFVAKEQIMAPFYSFGCCIIYFVFDELLRISYTITTQSYLCSTMVVFNLLSSLFWIFVWTKFFILYRNVCKNNTKKIPQGLTHLYTLKSIIYLLLISLIVCFVFFSFGLNKYALAYDNDMFKIFMFSFIILNGFVIPFCLPYFFFLRIYKDAKKKVANSSIEAKNEEKRLMNELSEFCKKIRV